MTNNEQAKRRGSSSLTWIVAIAIIVALGLWMFWPRHGGGPGEEGPPPGVLPVPSGSRSITLYFGTADAEGLVSEQREVAVSPEFLDQVEAVLRELAAGPVSEGAVSCLPDGTIIEEVFFDDVIRVLYVDFNQRLVSGHPGGSSGEYFTIASVVRTLGANFPEIAGVQFLVGGLEIETLAGHLTADEPFWVDDWR